MIKVAVTDKEYDKARDVFVAAGATGLECLRCPTPEADLAGQIRQEAIRHAIVGVHRYDGPLYEALSAGSVLARFGIGHDGIDKDRASARGILCTNTPGVLDDSVAELTIGLLLSAARHIPERAAAAKAGDWVPRLGHELRNRTLAVVGCGAIGRRVARIAAHGLGMRVVGCDVGDLDRESIQREAGICRLDATFESAATGADFVTLHIPSTPDTVHFVNRERLSALDSHAWLINTARGAVVDEAALYDALRDGRFGGAALDVFEHEPYQPVDPDKDLRTLPNVIMTPHIGSSTTAACDRMAERALHNIHLAEAGRFDEMNLLNRTALNL
jgi:phosphoglycerate dehydrogenase-like enzyme